MTPVTRNYGKSQWKQVLRSLMNYRCKGSFSLAYVNKLHIFFTMAKTSFNVTVQYDKSIRLNYGTVWKWKHSNLNDGRKCEKIQNIWTTDQRTTINETASRILWTLMPRLRTASVTLNCCKHNATTRCVRHAFHMKKIHNNTAWDCRNYGVWTAMRQLGLVPPLQRPPSKTAATEQQRENTTRKLKTLNFVYDLSDYSTRLAMTKPTSLKARITN